MNNIPSFPKIFAVGSSFIPQLFNGTVEITEKLDGSMIAFGNIDGELIIRSKGQRVYPETVDKMFRIAVDNIMVLNNNLQLTENWIYYGEYLRQPKHNVLKYNTVPNGNIALFAIRDEKGNFITEHSTIKWEARTLGLDVVPLLIDKTKVILGTSDTLDQLLNLDSYLGGTKIEGIVIKNYEQPFLLGGQPIPIMMGKYVSEQFKEIAHKSWNKEHTGKGKWEVFKSQFCTEARWNKAVQHLSEKGQLSRDPKDIGKIMKEINTDIELEERVFIQEFLWNEFGKEVLRVAGKGVAEWYKKQLCNPQFLNQLIPDGADRCVKDYDDREFE